MPLAKSKIDKHLKSYCDAIMNPIFDELKDHSDEELQRTIQEARRKADQIRGVESIIASTYAGVANQILCERATTSLAV